MSGATGKVSQLEKVMSLLATRIEELIKALPSEGTARMCCDLTPGLSTVMGSIARAQKRGENSTRVLSSFLTENSARVLNQKRA